MCSAAEANRKLFTASTKNFSAEKEKFQGEDSASLTKESSYVKLLCFQSLPCSGQLQWKYGTPSTKVPGGRHDMASSKSRHTSAAFSNLRHCENHSKMCLNSNVRTKRTHTRNTQF